MVTASYHLTATRRTRLTPRGVVSTGTLLLRYGATSHAGTSLERDPKERLHTLSTSGVESTGRVSRLYRKFGPAIYSRCRRLLKDDALAEDATQEVFVRVMRHIDSAPDDSAAPAWIYRISTNY